MANQYEDVRKLYESIAEFNVNGEMYYQLDNLDRDELVSTFVEIEKVDTDAFLKVKETLTRIGIANRTTKTLYQSCMILHKKGKFYICHFKELFAMDAKYTEMYKDDYARRNHIVKLLVDWKLIKVINWDIMNIPSKDDPINVYVLPYKEKAQWDLQTKYKIGTIPTRKVYNDR